MKYTFSLFLITLAFLSVPAFAQLQLINTIGGIGTAGYSGDGGAATSAQLDGPLGVAVDKSGNVFIEDYYNHRIRKISTTGKITTVVGNGNAGYSGDGSQATSASISPNGVAVDKNGNIYISDVSYSVVRKVNALGIISTVAGTGVAGYTGDGGPATAATLSLPTGLAVDSLGNLYIADAGNNAVRKVDAAGTITTIAGDGFPGSFGDSSLAVYAELDSPLAVAVDNYGDVYISDYNNALIRKIDTNGVINKVAGTYTVNGYTGDQGSAIYSELHGVHGLAVDNYGQLLIADAGNNVIRKIDTLGIITTIIGNGYAGFGGDSGTVNGANLHSPYGVAVDAQGSIYIADANNQRIRKAYNSNLHVDNVLLTGGIGVYPNPFTDNITVSGLSTSEKVAVYDMQGRQVTETWTIAHSGARTFNIPNVPSGVYMLQVWDNLGNRKAAIRLVKD